MYINPHKEQDPDSTIYKLMAVVIVVLLVGVIVLLVISMPQKPAEQPVFETEPSEKTGEVLQMSAEETTEIAISEPEPEPVEALLRETPDAGQEYIDRITFLGDSTTYGLKRYSMLKDGRSTTQVWTPSSGTLTLSQAEVATIYYPETESEITIKEAVELKKPEILVITLGVNGISFMEKDYFISCYKKVVNTVQDTSPETKIILQSIFPIAKSYEHQNQINNERINDANSWILEIAEDEGVHYLDTASALVGEDGFLPEEYQNGDGMHLNEVSFGIQLQYTRTHALEIEE